MQINGIQKPLDMHLPGQSSSLIKRLLGAYFPEQLPVEIVKWIYDFIVDGEVENALSMLDRLWPAIVWRRGNIILEVKVENEGKTTIAYDLKLSELTEDQKLKLDGALIDYAKYLEVLIPLVIGEEVVKKAVLLKLGHELLSVTHLLSDRNQVRKFFTTFTGEFVGYHFRTEQSGLINEAPEILGKSLREMPQFSNHFILQNLLTYLQVIEYRLKHEDGQKQCEVLWKMVEIISIAICHHADIRKILQIFLEVAECSNLEKYSKVRYLKFKKTTETVL